MIGPGTDKIGQRIKAAREAFGLTQQEMGEFLQVSRAAVSQWESGETMPGQRYWDLIATTLRMDVAYLLTGKGDPPKVPTAEDKRKLTTMRFQALILQGQFDGMIEPRIDELIKSGKLDKKLKAFGWMRRST
jgi:transcriptional regulator with XRE-family HTH domain